ncbi:MAG: prepilin-type N-terminal cleavage/methylation domain-containing protein [Planctomycetes bacterium]|nr:prepilin-type N-terminal cleavage/methylation domain-containing protein [Planctomycetota bacterium]
MNRRGFTLLELILVLALVVILASLVYPSFSAMQRAYRVEGAADGAKAGMLTARAQAIEEGRPYRFAVVPGKGNFRVAPDSPDFWGGGAPPTAAEGTAAPLILEDSLPQGTSFSDGGPTREGETALEPGAVSPSMWKAVAIFLPDGSARVPDGTDDSLPTVDLSVATEGTRPLVVTLRLLTGTVTVRRAQ